MSKGSSIRDPVNLIWNYVPTIWYSVNEVLETVLLVIETFGLSEGVLV